MKEDNSVERLFDSIKRGSEGLTRLVCTLPKANEEEKAKFKTNLLRHLMIHHGLKQDFDAKTCEPILINLEHALDRLSYKEYTELAVAVKPELKKNLRGGN